MTTEKLLICIPICSSYVEPVVTAIIKMTRAIKNNKNNADYIRCCCNLECSLALIENSSIMTKKHLLEWRARKMFDTELF